VIKMVKRLRVKKNKRSRNPRSTVRNPSRRTLSGPVSTINTAPVAIGNSIQGSRNIETPTKNGMIVHGRDFMFAPSSSGTVATWTMVGGMPLTPAAFADSVLSQYMRMYSKFRFKSIIVHYITASPTTATGDIMFYYNKDRTSVFLNQTSPQLLNFVLSDSNTVIGPQWTNHSARFEVTSDWKATDYGYHAGIEEYADGDLFLLSKTSTTPSPGYVLFDYAIEFAQRQIQPRLLNFPIPKIQWSPYVHNRPSAAVTAGDVATTTPGGAAFGGASGVGTALPTGWSKGDIYKVVLDITNSSFTGVTAATVLRFGYTSSGTDVPLVDGFTLYMAIIETNGQARLYQNAESAWTNSVPMEWQTSATIAMDLMSWISYVGNFGNINNIPNF